MGEKRSLKAIRVSFFFFFSFSLMVNEMKTQIVVIVDVGNNISNITFRLSPIANENYGGKGGRRGLCSVQVCLLNACRKRCNLGHIWCPSLLILLLLWGFEYVDNEIDLARNNWGMRTILRKRMLLLLLLWFCDLDGSRKGQRSIYLNKV